EAQLGQKPPTNEGWWPAYTAWQAFAVKVLVEGGRKQDSNITRLYGYRDHMPIFALAYLNDALVAKGEGGGVRSAERKRRIAAAATLGPVQVASAQFQGRSTDAKGTDMPMATLLASAPAGSEQPLTFTRTGAGTLFYTARLRYAVDRLFQEGSDQGIRIARSY